VKGPANDRLRKQRFVVLLHHQLLFAHFRLPEERSHGPDTFPEVWKAAIDTGKQLACDEGVAVMPIAA